MPILGVTNHYNFVVVRVGIVDHLVVVGVGDGNLNLEGKSDSFYFLPWHCQCEYIVRFYGQVLYFVWTLLLLPSTSDQRNILHRPLYVKKQNIAFPALVYSYPSHYRHSRLSGLGSCDSPSSFFLFFMLRAVGVGDVRRSRRFFRPSSVSSSSGKLLTPDENHHEKEGHLPSVSRYATGSVMTGAV